MSSPTVVREPARAAGSDVDLLRLRDGVTDRTRDLVVVEEPLEIRLNGWRWTVTMRTPGDDADLVIGLLASEGVITRADEVEALLFTRHPDEPDLANVADATLTRPLAELRARLNRHQVLTTSSCGLCGKSAIEALLTRRPPLAPGPIIAPQIVATLPQRLAAAQPIFHQTGGLHAAALFDAAGDLLAAREDVGRHNATDKVLGWRLRAGDASARAAVLLVSGRASFEIVQKAMVAGVPVVAAVSAPSSLAVALAREAAMTLVGFVRSGNLNVYAGAERLVPADAPRPTAASRASEASPATATPRAATASPRTAALRTATRTDAPRSAAAATDGDPLEFIPRVVRDALDACALKVSLRDWQALTRSERERLTALASEKPSEARPGDAPAPRADFAAYLRNRMVARTGQLPRVLDRVPVRQAVEASPPSEATGPTRATEPRRPPEPPEAGRAAAPTEPIRRRRS